MPSRRTWSPNGCCHDADRRRRCRLPLPRRARQGRVLATADGWRGGRQRSALAALGCRRLLSPRRCRRIDEHPTWPFHRRCRRIRQRLLRDSADRGGGARPAAATAPGIILARNRRCRNRSRSLAGTPTGVFVGIMSSEWSNLQILDFAGLTAFRGTGSGYFMTANRISYHLGLTGPSVAIDSACSSSLTAVHQGCAALRSGEADTVIAAGVESHSDTGAFDLLHPGRAVRAGRSLQTVRTGRRRHRPGRGRGRGSAAPTRRRPCRRAADLCRREEFGHQPRRPQQRHHRPEPPVAGGVDAPGAEPGRGRGRTDRLRRSARHRHGARRHDRSQRAWRRAQDTTPASPVCSVP